MVHRSSTHQSTQPKAAEKEKVKEYGRGNRVRKQVNYCNDLTDEQLLKMCEEDDDVDDCDSSLIAVPRRRGRRPRTIKEGKSSEIIPEEMEEDNKIN